MMAILKVCAISLSILVGTCGGAFVLTSSKGSLENRISELEADLAELREGTDQLKTSHRMIVKDLTHGYSTRLKLENALIAVANNQALGTTLIKYLIEVDGADELYGRASELQFKAISTAKDFEAVLNFEIEYPDR